MVRPITVTDPSDTARERLAFARAGHSGEFIEPRRSLAPGDVVECEIERIGTLRNPVEAQTEEST